MSIAKITSSETEKRNFNYLKQIVNQGTASDLLRVFPSKEEIESFSLEERIEFLEVLESVQSKKEWDLSEAYKNLEDNIQPEGFASFLSELKFLVKGECDTTKFENALFPGGRLDVSEVQKWVNFVITSGLEPFAENDEEWHRLLNYKELKNPAAIDSYHATFALHNIKRNF